MERHSEEIDVSDNPKVIELLREGNDSCFDAVYRYYFRGLCGYASQFLSEDRAKEVVQETMMWLWENRRSLMPGLSLRSLLFVIVRNRSLNRISHNRIKRRVHQQIVERYREEFENPDMYLENELFEKFSQALRRLPAEYRRAFEMHRMEGLTHKEIAGQLGVSHQTVNYRIGQALKLLRVELGDFLPLFLFLIG